MSVRITDNGDGSTSIVPAELPDDEFEQLAPSRHRLLGFPVTYRSLSGRIVPRHDPYDATISFLGHVFDGIFVILAAAFLFGVALCCIPALAHLIFAA